MLERAQAVTREEEWTRVEHARFADDLVVLVHAYPRHPWLRTAVERRLLEEFAKLEVAVNEDKSRRVDPTQGECFGFLGFEFRRIRSCPRAMDAAANPATQEADGVAADAQAGVSKPSVPARRRGDCSHQSDTARLGAILCGRPLQPVFLIRDWVQKKIRAHLARTRQRHGFGWKRRIRAWLYGTLGLFSGYRVAH